MGGSHGRQDRRRQSAFFGLPQRHVGRRADGGEVPGQVESEEAATNAQRLSADPRFRVPVGVTVQARAGEDQKELNGRILRQAASRAGLDGTAEQEEFVRMFENPGIQFKTATDDPRPATASTSEETT